MFIPSTNQAEGWTSLYKPTDISAAENNLNQVDKAAEKRKLHDEAVQASKAKALELITKHPDSTREEDNDYFQKAFVDHNQTIYDNMADYYSPDINKSTKAAIAIRDKTAELTAGVNSSIDTKKRIAAINATVAHEAAMSSPTQFRDNGWSEEQKKPYKDIDWTKTPQPVYPIEKDSKENLVPYLKQTGTVTEKPLLVNGKPQYLPNGGIAMVQSEEADPVALNNDFHAHYVANPNLPKETELTFGEREARKTPLRPSLVTEGKLVQGKVPTYEDYKGTDENGVSGINTPQFYADQLTPFVPTKSKIVNSAGAQSVTSSGGPTYAQTIPIVAQGGKESPILSYPLATDKSAVRADIGGKTYDVTSLEDVRVDSDGKPVSGYGIIAKPTSKYIDAQHAFDKKHTSIQTTHDKLITLADEGKDEKGKPLDIPVDQQKSIINQTTKSQFNELEKHVPKADDYPTDTEKKLMTGAEIEKASKGVDIKELVKNGKTKGARLVDYTTENKPISTVNNFDEYVNLYKSTKGIPDAATLKKLKEKWDSKIK